MRRRNVLILSNAHEGLATLPAIVDRVYTTAPRRLSITLYICSLAFELPFGVPYALSVTMRTTPKGSPDQL